jgi:predicted AAA+ superfamily ATPase
MDDKSYKRSLESTLIQASTQFPVILVVGPRQVGKTTLLKNLSANQRTYVTLDDPQMALLAKTDPALFLQRFTPPVLIDEIQYAPELLPHIKMKVDEEKKVGAFWLTGSQQFHLMKGVSESLAGRVGILNLLGLSLRELYCQSETDSPFLPTEKILKSREVHFSKLTLDKTYHMIWHGSYPALWASDHGDHDLFYSSYVQTYLQRDVRDLAHVGDQSLFLKFLRAAAARTGQLLNLSEMARDASISPSTAQRWLSILQTSGIVYLLEPYHNNLTKRLIKTPKLYFLDTGLCAYLTEWSSAKTLEAGAMSGAILETFIFIELLKSYWHHGKRAPFYYYRDKDKKEIDLLIVQDDQIYPLEFKKTASPHPSMVRNFATLQNSKKTVSQGALICLCDTMFPLINQVQAVPLGFL